MRDRFMHIDSIEQKCSTDNYLNNFEENFYKHYTKIDIYINNLRKIGIINDKTKFKICFFIEDVTCFGSFILDESDPKGIVLLYVKQFLDILENSDRVDYVFFGGQHFNKKCLWFMSRDNINAFRKKEINIKDKEFFYSSKPQTISYPIFMKKLSAD